MGETVVVVDSAFAESMQAGDTVLAVASSQSLKRIPIDVKQLVSRAVENSQKAFNSLSRCSAEQVNLFYSKAADLMEDDDVFASVLQINESDVASAVVRGRSTTRLAIDQKMRLDMIAAFRMWRDIDMAPNEKLSSIAHEGWEVEQWRAPLGALGFVFEGRPNVFADATGVLKGGNTVVFRIGSDALGTAKEIMRLVVRPALEFAHLPSHAVQLLESKEHAAGWALFSDNRLSLAVARGSGAAVSELGSIAQSSGVPMSLHGTGGAWMIVGDSADEARLSQVVEHSLDRKVCNTLNTVCITSSQASHHVPIVFEAAQRAARSRGVDARIHCVGGAEHFLSNDAVIEVHRTNGSNAESQISVSQISELGDEFEWEVNPEIFIVIVDSVDAAVELFNSYSPQFVLSLVSQDDVEHEMVWQTSNSPFMGDGFTRWVDGQFALLRPELGLSNWQNGRLFTRSGVLSGDSAFTVRLRVRQTKLDLHR